MVQVTVQTFNGREYIVYSQERKADRVRFLFHLLRAGQSVFLDHGIYRIDHVGKKLYRLTVLDGKKFYRQDISEVRAYWYIRTSLSISCLAGSKYQQYGNVKADKASYILSALKKGLFYRTTKQEIKYQSALQLALSYGFDSLETAIESFTDTVNGQFWTAPNERQYPRTNELAK